MKNKLNKGILAVFTVLLFAACSSSVKECYTSIDSSFIDNNKCDSNTPETVIIDINLNGGTVKTGESFTQRYTVYTSKFWKYILRDDLGDGSVLNPPAKLKGYEFVGYTFDEENEIEIPENYHFDKNTEIFVKYGLVNPCKVNWYNTANDPANPLPFIDPDNPSETDIYKSTYEYYGVSAIPERKGYMLWPGSGDYYAFTYWTNDEGEPIPITAIDETERGKERNYYAHYESGTLINFEFVSEKPTEKDDKGKWIWPISTDPRYIMSIQSRENELLVQPSSPYVEKWKPGYKVDGWYYLDDNDNEVKWNFDTRKVLQSDNKLHLFPHWAAQEYKLNISPNGGKWVSPDGSEDIKTLPISSDKSWLTFLDEHETDLKVNAPTDYTSTDITYKRFDTATQEWVLIPSVSDTYFTSDTDIIICYNGVKFDLVATDIIADGGCGVVKWGSNQSKSYNVESGTKWGDVASQFENRTVPSGATFSHFVYKLEGDSKEYPLTNNTVLSKSLFQTIYPVCYVDINFTMPDYFTPEESTSEEGDLRTSDFYRYNQPTATFLNRTIWTGALNDNYAPFPLDEVTPPFDFDYFEIEGSKVEPSEYKIMGPATFNAKFDIVDAASFEDDSWYVFNKTLQQYNYNELKSTSPYADDFGINDTFVGLSRKITLSYIDEHSIVQYHEISVKVVDVDVDSKYNASFTFMFMDPVVDQTVKSDGESDPYLHDLSFNFDDSIENSYQYISSSVDRYLNYGAFNRLGDPSAYRTINDDVETVKPITVFDADEYIDNPSSENIEVSYSSKLFLPSAIELGYTKYQSGSLSYDIYPMNGETEPDILYSDGEKFDLFDGSDADHSPFTIAQGKTMWTRTPFYEARSRAMVLQQNKIVSMQVHKEALLYPCFKVNSKVVS